MNYDIKNAKVLREDGSIECIETLYIRNGKWTAQAGSVENVEVLEGVHLFPCLTELFADFKEPGREHIYTLEDGANAMLKGGFGRVLLSPDTLPVIDESADVEGLKQKITQLPVQMEVVGGISRNLEGETLPEMLEMKRQGAVAFGNGLRPLPSDKYLRSAMRYATQVEIRLHLFPMTKDFNQPFYFPEGPLANQFGLKGIPKLSEEIAVYRILQLAKLTGCPVHLMFLTSSESVRLVKRFKEDGVDVTCDVNLSNLLFDEKDLSTLSSAYHLCPPVRNLGEDRKYLLAQIENGFIDAISTQHIPVLPEFKNTVYEASEPGIATLECALSSANTFLPELKLETFVLAMTSGPAKVLGKTIVFPKIDGEAPFILFDSNKTWIPHQGDFAGNICNSPFIFKELKGKVIFNSLVGVTDR